MKKIFTLLMGAMALSATAQELTTEGPQLVNGDFETWNREVEVKGTTSKYLQNWNSFESATGGLATTAAFKQVEQSSDVRPGSTGTSSAKIFSRNVLLGIKAQGNLTTGYINAGSMQAAGKGNNNQAHVDDNNACQQLGALPKAVRFWAKFNPNKATDEARFSATVHDNYNFITYGTQAFQDEDTENQSHAVAQGALNFTSTDGQWKEFVVELSTEGCTATNPDYIMINFSTNAIPGGGSANDTLYIDDVELLYAEAIEDERPDFTFNDILLVNSSTDGGYSIPDVATIEIYEQEEGSYKLQLKNFVLKMAEDSMAVGHINVENVVGETTADGNINLKGNYNAVLSDGDLEGVDFWLGSMLGKVPVSLDMTFNLQKMTGVINIEMEGMGTIQVLYGQAATDEIAAYEAEHTTSFDDYEYFERSGIETVDPAPATWMMAQSIDGTYTLTIPNVIVAYEEGDEVTEMPVGTFVIKGLNPTSVTAGATNFDAVDAIATLQDGDEDASPYWLTQYLLKGATLPVEVTANIVEGRLTASVIMDWSEAAFPLFINAYFGQKAIETDVNGVAAATTQNAQTYTLSGARAQKNFRGLVIKGGKKMIQK